MPTHPPHARAKCYTRPVSGNPTARATAITLGRDKHTCQVCGARAVFTTTTVTTPPDAPCAATTHIAVCRNCEHLFDAPFDDTPALQHLIETRRTCNYGMPYLFAQLRAVAAPLTPTTTLDDDARTLLHMLRATPDRLRLKTARQRLHHLTRLQFRRVLDQLEWHGYARDGLEGSALLRIDYYLRPPLLENLTPIPNDPALLCALADGRPLETDPAAYLLANLYRYAGTTLSKRQLKKRLLLSYVPEDVFGPRLLFIHRTLIALGLLSQQRDPSTNATTYRLTRSLRLYTSLHNYQLLTQLLTLPNSNDWDTRLRIASQAGLTPNERRTAINAASAAMRLRRARQRTRTTTTPSTTPHARRAA